MSGYNVAGVPLLVTAIPVSKVSPTLKKPDLRRNLYVLGLPIDLTKSEFTSIFSRFGKVSHCVILVTVDTVSRRRGFVVMSTHEEAKLAMDGLSGTDIKEHTIDVSWAVVQRSRGFLDGGDRAVVLDSREPSNFTSSDSGTTTPDSLTTTSGNSSSLCTSSINFLPPTSAKLLVTNLSTLLFSDHSDLNPLLCPFGSIHTMRILNSDADNAVISVVVEYRTFPEAQEAKAHLHGQIYAGFSLKVDHIHSGIPLEDSQVGWWRAPCGKASLSSSGHRKRSSPLNPFAAPFVAESQNNLSLSVFNPSSNFNPDYSYPASERKPLLSKTATANSNPCFRDTSSALLLPQCFLFQNASQKPSFHAYLGQLHMERPVPPPHLVPSREPILFGLVVLKFCFTLIFPGATKSEQNRKSTMTWDGMAVFNALLLILLCIVQSMVS
ncbi:hypothetical protein PILCRDRAFT_134882 [Piloderma croceum F 1598]|uniref:RRM domain-containing protein n=1 Tax=Piloderma croceum (strain F 1598) TaxID=765440 RepID=A0A0C3G5Y5_PILCF|nr:hypothetical protein PILCRDRAFT_134882 [Piloderma croceum F 1598]